VSDNVSVIIASDFFVLVLKYTDVTEIREIVHSHTTSSSDLSTCKPVSVSEVTTNPIEVGLEFVILAYHRFELALLVLLWDE